MNGSAPLGKRAYVPDAADLEAVKKIRSQEIELRDRNTVLRGVKQNVSVSLRRAVRRESHPPRRAGLGIDLAASC